MKSDQGRALERLHITPLKRISTMYCRETITAAEPSSTTDWGAKKNDADRTGVAHAKSHPGQTLALCSSASGELLLFVLGISRTAYHLQDLKLWPQRPGGTNPTRAVCHFARSSKSSKASVTF